VWLFWGEAKRQDQRNSAPVALVDLGMSELTMYTTSWCGYSARLKSDLKRAGVEYREVDIEQHPEAVSAVTEVNHGNQTVPTLVFSDGSAMTNPSVAEVTGKLAALT